MSCYWTRFYFYVALIVYCKFRHVIINVYMVYKANAANLRIEVRQSLLGRVRLVVIITLPSVRANSFTMVSFPTGLRVSSLEHSLAIFTRTVDPG